jgi:NADH-quinone oxidoreductase subunit A
MQLWRLGAYAVGVLVLLAIMLAVPQLLGERQRHPHTGTPYEGGVLITGSARVRLSAQYYVIAMVFVVFDLEAAFLFAWAVAARQLGWAAWVEVVVFVAVLLATLVYLWRAGALDWGTGVVLRRRARAGERVGAAR